MSMCIVKKEPEELLEIGLPGTAGVLVEDVELLEAKAVVERWRQTPMGQILAASISSYLDPTCE